MVSQHVALQFVRRMVVACKWTDDTTKVYAHAIHYLLGFWQNEQRCSEYFWVCGAPVDCDIWGVGVWDD